MLGKFKSDWGFLPPLLAHCAVHMVFTAGIVAAFGKPELAWLGIVDFVAHFFMDRIKASPKYLGRWKIMSANEMVLAMSDRARKYQGIDLHEPLSLIQRGHELKSIDQRIRQNTLAWWALGLDQLWHHLTDLAVVYWMVAS